MRGMGVLAVMVTHFARHLAATPGIRAIEGYFDVSAFAMEMFFLLSGFLITGILLEARDKPRYFRNFYMRRVLRILPLYYGVLFVVFVVRPSWGRAVGGTSSPVWLWTYVQNVVLARRNSWTYGLLDHFWSLAVEEQYYLVWPLVVFLFRPRQLLAVCGLLFVFSVAGRFVMTSGWRHLVSAYVATPFQLDPLVAGGALAVLVREVGLARLRVSARVAVLVSLGVYFALGWYRLPMMSRPLVVGRPLLSSLLFGGIILLAVGEAGLFRRVLGARIWTFLGRYSYGLYVYHFLLIAWFVRWIPVRAIGEAVGRPWVGHFTGILIALAVSLVVAVASYELYEKQFLKLKTRFAA